MKLFTHSSLSFYQTIQFQQLNRVFYQRSSIISKKKICLLKTTTTVSIDLNSYLSIAFFPIWWYDLDLGLVFSPTFVKSNITVRDRPVKLIPAKKSNPGFPGLSRKQTQGYQCCLAMDTREVSSISGFSSFFLNFRLDQSHFLIQHSREISHVPRRRFYLPTK